MLFPASFLEEKNRDTSRWFTAAAVDFYFVSELLITSGLTAMSERYFLIDDITRLSFPLH